MNCRAEKLGVRFVTLIEGTAVQHNGVLADTLPNSSLDASAGSALHVGSPVPFPRRVNSTVRQLSTSACTTLSDNHLIALSAAVPRSLPPRVQAYLEAIVRTCADSGGALVSVVLFGSAATGGFSGAASDVDLILVLPDDASQDDRCRLRGDVVRLEALHGFRPDSSHPRGALEAFVERVTANVRSFFVCTRGDLLSGDVARILDLRPSQAVFVDRVVVPSIVGSAVTVWGEDLLPHVPLSAVRRFDVFKALFGLSGQVLLCAAVFPALPAATKYAMGALKRSVHNCFFCYHTYPAPLEEEVAFFQRRARPSRTLAQLLDLRREYRPSFAFVVRCLPAMARLHLRTALDNRFPRAMLRRG